MVWYNDCERMQSDYAKSTSKINFGPRGWSMIGNKVALCGAYKIVKLYLNPRND